MNRRAVVLLGAVTVLGLGGCGEGDEDPTPVEGLPATVRVIMDDRGCRTERIELSPVRGLRLENEARAGVTFEILEADVVAQVQPGLGGAIEIYPNVDPVDGVDPDRVFFPAMEPDRPYDYQCGPSVGTLTLVVNPDPQGTPVLPAPVNVATPAVTDTTVTLQWGMPPGTIERTSGFEVHQDGRLLGTTQVPTFAARDLICNTRYVFTIVALDATGARSPASVPLRVRTDPC